MPQCRPPANLTLLACLLTCCRADPEDLKADVATAFKDLMAQHGCQLHAHYVRQVGLHGFRFHVMDLPEHSPDLVAMHECLSAHSQAAALLGPA